MKSGKGKLAGCAYFFLLAALVVVCSGLGMLWNASTPVIYKSQCVFQITPTVIAGGKVDGELAGKLVELCEQPHGQRISDRQHVGACLTANSLFVLDSFVGKTAAQIVDGTASQLNVNELGNESNIYEVTLTGTNPQDCATILNNLVYSYRQRLSKEYPDLRGHYDFTFFAVARVGDQIYPILPFSLAIGFTAALIVASVVWFLFDPLRMGYPRFSLVDGVWMAILTVCFFCLALASNGFSGGFMEFESTAVLRIEEQVSDDESGKSDAEKRLIELNKEDHATVFTQYRPVESALHQSSLFVLDAFVDLSKEEVVELVQHNLQAQTGSKGPNETMVSFRSSDPVVAQDVLQALVDSYVQALKKTERTIDERWQQKIVAEGLDKSEFCPAKKYATTVVVQPTAGQPVTRRLRFQRIESFAAAFIAAWLAVASYLIWRATRSRMVVATEQLDSTS